MALRVVIAASTCLLAACSPAHQVTYKVIGDPDWPKTDGMGPWAQITMQNDNGGTEQREVPTPYSQQLTVPAGAFIYISAQAKDGMQISCEIDEDGAPIKQSNSEGQFSIATCSSEA